MADTTQIDDSGPAFASVTSVHSEIDYVRMSDGAFNPDTAPKLTKIVTTGGMSLRAWFAGQALVGYRASETDPTIAKMPGSVVARAALADADAMIAALKEKP